LESDPEVLRYIGRQPLSGVGAYRQHLRSNILPLYDSPGGHGAWAVLERSTGEFIGVGSLKPALEARYAAGMGYCPGERELGYGLRRSSWGQGYATELVRALVLGAFAEMEAPCVVASVWVANRASVRVLQKAGLRQVGGPILLPDEDQPSLKFVLNRG